MQYSRKRSSRWRQTCQDWAHTNGVARDWLSRVVPDALLVSTCKHVRFGRLSLSCVVILSDAAWQKIIAADFYRIEEGPAQASGALVLAPVVLRGSTRSVASLEAVLGATGRSRQRSCFAVDERLLLPQHRSAADNQYRIRFGQVRSWVVAGNQPTDFTPSAIKHAIPVRARVKLFDHVPTQGLRAHMKHLRWPKTTMEKVWVPTMAVHLQSYQTVILPADLVTVDACIVQHPQKCVRSAGYAVVLATNAICTD